MIDCYCGKNGRSFCVLDTRTAKERKLNGIRKKECIVGLSDQLKIQLERIFSQKDPTEKDLERLFKVPDCFLDQLRLSFCNVWAQAGWAEKELYRQLDLKQRVSDYCDLLTRAMQDNLSKNPNLRFKVLISRKMSSEFYESLLYLFHHKNMDVRLEMVQIHFFDEIIEAGAEEYPVLREISFKIGNEMLLNFEKQWMVPEKSKSEA